MVVFTCNHCGDSLQKPKVEKHYQFMCKNEKSLTCVDCFKDFRAEEYVTHTKCVTEDERYAAKGTYTNGIVKKGEVKQESWVEMIKSILHSESNLKPSCRNLLNIISSYNNIPRKKQKFINFIKSSSGGRVNMKDVEDVWDIIEKYKNEKAQNQNSAGKTNKPQDEGEKCANNENGSGKRKSLEEPEDTPKKKKSKKHQQTEDSAKENETINGDNTENTTKKKKHKKETAEIPEVQNTEATDETEKFNFQEKILEILAKKQSISLSKLQKKVLNAYIKVSGEAEVTPKAIKKFNKKLKKIPEIQINDDQVTIVKN